MIKGYGYQLVGLLLLAGFGACKKFVSISPPSTEVVTASVFNNDASAVAAQTAIYTQMQVNMDPFSLSLNNGLLADELTNYSSNPIQIEYYTNSLQSKDIANPWIDAYNYIFQSNAVISGLQNFTGVTAVSKQQLTGEAKFIRAFWDFYLVNYYGNIPLVNTTDYAVNADAIRTPIGDVYRQIIADLTGAESLLNSNYVDGTDSVTTLERVRPTKWAAAAMLARAYLYNGSYDSAEQQSTLVINNNLYQLCQSLDSVFLANNTEAIWQLPPVQPNSNDAVPEGQYFVLITAPGGSNIYNNATISPQLIGSFETGDLRESHWVNVYPSNGYNYYYPYKYKQYLTSSLTEYTVVLRLAEQYLIRAEARAKQGNSGGAIADLNIIRSRAGLPAYSGSSDQATILNAILHERQVELFTEWGHRWFDLIRTNNVNAVMSIVTPTKGGTWTSNWALYPIPFSEVNVDTKLVQNSGY